MSIFSSPYIVVPFVSWLIAQTTKLLLQASHGDFSWKYLYKSGNMPSSHTAIVIALLVVLAFLNGVESAEFGIGAVFSLIVVYDAFGVRRAVGEQGGVLARLIELSRTPKEQREAFKIREVLGHTPVEVAAGGLIGLMTSGVLMFRHWPEGTRDLFNTITDTERTVYYGLFILVFTLSQAGYRLIVKKGLTRLPTSKRLKRTIRYSFSAPAILGLVAVWLQSEGIRLFTTKFWVLAAIGWILAVGGVNYFRVVRQAKAALKEEHDHFQVAKRETRQSKRARRTKRKRKK
ncbi:MAG TPA: divergent PAP2 family protein [Candidatus Saccharimonadales bacterium]